MAVWNPWQQQNNNYNSIPQSAYPYSSHAGDNTEQPPQGYTPYYYQQEGLGTNLAQRWGTQNPGTNMIERGQYRRADRRGDRFGRWSNVNQRLSDWANTQADRGGPLSGFWSGVGERSGARAEDYGTRGQWWDTYYPGKRIEEGGPRGQPPTGDTDYLDVFGDMTDKFRDSLRYIPYEEDLNAVQSALQNMNVTSNLTGGLNPFGGGRLTVIIMAASKAMQ